MISSRTLAGLAVVGLCGCASLAAYREPFVGPGKAVSVAWRRQLTDRQLVGGHTVFMRDGKAKNFSTGLDIEYLPQEFAGAASDGKRVFVGSTYGLLWALDANDGRLLWRRPLAGPISSQPAFIADQNLLLVGDDDGALWAIDPETGAERWVYRVHGPITQPPVYADGLVFFTSSENRVYAVDAVRGTWKWQYDREAPEGFTIRGEGGPLVDHGRVYVGFSDGFLAALEARTGDIVWVRGIGGESKHYSDVDSTPIMHGGVLYASSVATGVFALDPKDGSVRWHFDVDGAGSIQIGNDKLYFAAGHDGMHCLDLDGHLIWRQALSGAGSLSTPLVVPGWVLVSGSSSGVYVADAETGRLDQFLHPGDGVTSAPTSDGEHVFVVSNGGFIYSLSLHAQLPHS